ncbi:hypothetical protein VaNZ11_009932 [Volvox africanus]|uniref:Zinc transporter n=1 Tax=Volvox africanus TaxID=51714 RepID=A0ABQ5S9R5_9CHLO|nr:hypothetical protein VaNZ11_009932 [Volvox africanus]
MSWRLRQAARIGLCLLVWSCPCVHFRRPVYISCAGKNNLYLAASLAFAAGVMLYISLVDIYAGKAVSHFVEAGHADSYAFTYATICFFCGFPISWLLDKLAERLAYRGDEGPTPAPKSLVLEKMQPEDSALPATNALSSSTNVVDVESASDGSSQQVPQISAEQSSVKMARSRKLVHMGILAAMAVALHNMPEGLVTLVGYMDSIKSGITTAVAIAIHNIPEGIVITSAVYFGTGLRRRAILMAALAAFTEPLGGLIGLAVVCGGSMTETVFGIRSSVSWGVS